MSKIPAKASEEWESLDWADPSAEFSVLDDGDPHGELYIIFPGGQLVNIGGHDDYATDLRRAEWMCRALNDARKKAVAPVSEETAKPCHVCDGTGMIGRVGCAVCGGLTTLTQWVEQQRKFALSEGDGDYARAMDELGRQVSTAEELRRRFSVNFLVNCNLGDST
jgi:hypothetical protein